MRLLVLIVGVVLSGIGLAQTTYVLKPGDDFLMVAEQLRPPKATVNQMGLALVKVNQKALQTRVTWRLPPGTAISIPDEKTVMSVDAETAEREFNKLWRAEQHYRAAVALEGSKDTLYAFVSYVEAAKLGHGRAQLRLAQLYDNDLSGFVRHDLMESAQWYEKARQSQVEFATQRGRTQASPGRL